MSLPEDPGGRSGMMHEWQVQSDKGETGRPQTNGKGCPSEAEGAISPVSG